MSQGTSGSTVEDSADDVNSTSPTSTSTTTNDDPNTTCTPDELIALVRAVKFAQPDMSIRNVHAEISESMAMSDPSYAFLKDVKMNDVKKVWKKALKGADTTNNNKIPSPSSTKKNESSNNCGDATKSGENEPIFPSNADGVLKIYTVGDGSVKTLAENYAKHYAQAAVEETNKDADEISKYTSFFVDVPADLSGKRPHQALINFNENKKGGKGKGKQRNNSNKAAAAKGKVDDDGREIFKIQLAALPPGMEDAFVPMLLYNSDRSAKTFLHPPSFDDDNTDDDGGYQNIKDQITNSGTSGALGATGGQKAYFYGFVTETKTGPNVVSIDIQSGLAPNQTW